MRTDQSRLRRPGIAAAIAALPIAGVVGGVGVAGATENKTIYAVENGARPVLLDRRTSTTCVPASARRHASRPATRSRGTSAPRCIAQRRLEGADARGTRRGTPAQSASCRRRADQDVDVRQGRRVRVRLPGATPAWRARSSSRARRSRRPTAHRHGHRDELDGHRDADVRRHRAPPARRPRPTTTSPRPRPGKAARKDTQAPRLTAREGQGGLGGRQAELLGLRARDAARSPRGAASARSRRRTLHVAAGTRVGRRCAARACARRGPTPLEWRAVDAMAQQGRRSVKKTLKVKR